jgi:hypothetical protein
MKAYSIEDTIIGYFDGRLNDSESAELLHRVSVSPEIRERFQEHEMLRDLAVRSARNVSIPPHLEEAVFAQVAALQQQDRDLLPVGFWSVRRFSVAAAAIALLMTGSLGSVEFGGSGLPGSHANVAAIGGHAKSDGISAIVDRTDRTDRTDMSHLTYSAKAGHPMLSISHEGDRRFAEPTADEPQQSIAEMPSQPAESAIEITPSPRPGMVAAIVLPGVEHLTLASLRDLPSVDDASRFEVGLETASQFSVPASNVSTTPFLDYRFHAGYNLDANDQVGLRIRRGSFEKLNVGAVNDPAGFTDLTGSVSAQLMYSEEIYFERSQPIDGGRFFIVAGVGGGLYDAGTLLSADIGVKIPVADHLMAGFGLALSRLSQSGSTSQMMGSHSEPVIYDGVETRNTINGRLEYGLSYRF